MREKIARQLAHQLELNYDLVESKLEVPPNTDLGDFAFPCFLLAAQRKNSPENIAKELEKKIEIGGVSKLEAKGAYLNIFIDRTVTTKTIFNKILNKEFNFHIDDDIKKVMVEYISPNSNKPLHIGHLRNMLLGSLYCNILSKVGKEVHPTCLINDKGVHICKSMLAYKLFGNNKNPNIKGDHFVGKFYTKFGEEAEKDPRLNEMANQMLEDWESGDKETLLLWKKMNAWSEAGQKETWEKFGIRFDKIYKESEVYKQGKEIVKQGIEKGIFKIDDNATIADLNQFGLDVIVAIRKNGTSLYIVQDLYLANKKIMDFEVDASVYVIGSEQDHYMRQLFKILDLYGYSWAKNLYHLSYGLIELTTGKMKSREGKVVETDEFYSEMIELAKNNLKSRDGDLNKAELIAQAAIRFYILKHDNKKGFIYNPGESLRFDGSTGVYLLYTYARINSIIKKASFELNEENLKDIDYNNLINDYELIQKLSQIEDIIKSSYTKKKFSSICNYIIDIAQLFNTMYSKEKIIEMDESKQKSKLLLLKCVQNVMEELFDVLNIEYVDEL